jgi:CO/xanthine dehydrogenase FAD-binding subunit
MRNTGHVKIHGPEAFAGMRRAGRLAAEDTNPPADLRGSEDYKRAMVMVYTQRSLTEAVDRARR